ncbi:Trihelix transcription factor GT-3b [Quillaja saponaria]|uniref:Trihelix transcription factor GT-3b n=1 Tax=Quillaja saponaria TaxID=32244 RepID=A0AAD7LNA8_QUISA|nr:Trihelix transcription factor GT-3b [Quillaja saponaria]
MEPYHFHQQVHPHNISSSSTINVDASSDRFPQWSIQETKEFLMIRAGLDRTFMETKRNKLLWEVISTKMKEKGFNRSADQCKCKWKNLVTRYKGCETMEVESVRQQFPYYSELQAIFATRTQRMMWIESEGGGSGSRKKEVQFSSDEEEEEESVGEKSNISRKKNKKQGKSNVNMSTGVGSKSGSGNSNDLQDILREYMKQQMQMEAQWMEAFEARENEKLLKEMEWKQTMDALENERIMMNQRWREREEQRRTERRS